MTVKLRSKASERHAKERGEIFFSKTAGQGRKTAVSPVTATVTLSCIVAGQGQDIRHDKMGISAMISMVSDVSGL